MNGTDTFQKRYGEEFEVGELAPSGTWLLPFSIGLAMEKSGEEICVPANGQFTGFLSKEVTADGPTFEEMELGYPNLPTKIGEKATLTALQDGALIEVEGEDAIAYSEAGDHLLVTTGTGHVNTDTAEGTSLSFKQGKWYIAQTGDFVFGILRKQLTPVTAGNIRLEIEIRRGDIVTA